MQIQTTGAERLCPGVSATAGVRRAAGRRAAWVVLAIVALTGAGAALAGESPVVVEVSLSPAAPDVTGPIVATYESTGGPVVRDDFNWYVDGMKIGGVDGDTLDPDHFAEGAGVAVSVSVSDGGRWSPRVGSETVTVHNAPPELVSVGGVPAGSDPLSFDVDEGETLSLALVATDPDRDVLEFDATGLPAGASIQGDRLRWTPARGQAGVYRDVVVLVRDDDAASDSVALELTVAAADRAPTVESVWIVPAVADTTTPLTARFDWSDPDADPLAEVRYRWTVDEVEIAGATGAELPPEHFARDDLVRVKVSVLAGEQWSERVVSDPTPIANARPTLVSIGGLAVVDGAPVEIVVGEGEPLSLEVVATDPDGDAWTVGGSDLPPGARLEGTALVWTPDYTHAGLDPLSTVTVSDGELADTAQVQFRVLDTNRAPWIRDPGAQRVDELELLELALEFGDHDGDPVEIVPGALPRGAQIDVLTGILTWTPELDQAGSYALEVTAIDSRPDALPATVEIPVEVGDTAVLDTGDGLRLGFDAGGRLSYYGRDRDVVPAGARGGVFLVDRGSSATAPLVPLDGWSVEEARDAALVYEPDGSHRLESNAPSGELVLVSENLPVDGAEPYRLELIARTAHGFWGTGPDWDPHLSAELAVRWLDADGAELGRSAPLRIAGSTRSWTRFGISVVPAHRAVEAVLELSLSGVVPRTDGAALWAREPRFGPSSSRTVWPVGTVTRTEPGRLELALTDEETGWQVDMTLVASADHVRADGTVTNLRPELPRRAVDVGFAVPWPAGWRWWDDPLRARDAVEAKVYANTANVHETGALPVSLYPLAFVDDGSQAYALGWPMSAPQLGCLQLDQREGLWSISFPLGVSPDATRFPDRATFSWLAFTVDEPEWGMRAALARYYEIDAASFAERIVDGEPLRVSGEGLHAGQQVSEPEDYNIRYVLGRHDQNFPGSLEYIDDEDLLLAHYTRPWDLNASAWPLSGPPPDYDAVVDEITRMAEGDGVDAEMAAAALVSLARSPKADVVLQRLDEAPTHAAARWTARIPLNLDPELPGETNAATAAWEVDLAAGLETVPESYDDIAMAWFVDGVGSSSRHLDFDVVRHAYADLALTYSENTFSPAASIVLRNVEFLRWAQEQMASMGDDDDAELFLIGNMNDLAVAAPAAPYVDFHVYEADATALGADAMRAQRLHHRFLARYRPLAEIYQPVIGDSSWSEWSDFEEGYLRPQWHGMMLYGIHPSVLAQIIYAGVSVRDGRALYEQMSPAVQELQEIGWEPVPYAVADDERLAVERFGRGGDTRIVVHNPADEAIPYALDVELAPLDLRVVTSIEDRLTEERYMVHRLGGLVTIDDTLPPHTARVFAIAGTP